MAVQIRKIDYYNLTVKDQPGEALKVLSDLKELGVSMQAFSVVPMGPAVVLTLFPNNSDKLSKEMRFTGVNLDGPHHALLVQGTDEIGILTNIHQKLYDAGVNVSASNAVTNGKGGFGYIIYIRADEFDNAAKTLDI